MKVIKKVTVELGEEELKLIVAEYMKNEGYNVEPQNVSFNLGTRCVGYFMDEHDQAYFKGCTVNCVMK